MNLRRLNCICAVSLLLPACGPKVDVPGDTDGVATDSADSGGPQPPNPSTTASPSTTSQPDDDDDDDDDDADTTAGDDDDDDVTTGDDDDDAEGTDHGDFISNPDGGGLPIECSTFAQDCPRGEKCMPWANDGGSTWNATRCSPVVDDPGAPGDACTVEGSAVSGIDSCDVGVMCFHVDADTLEGTCIELCGGSPADPLCTDRDVECTFGSSGPALCLPSCNPLMQDCPEEQACYPVNESFACLPTAGKRPAPQGTPCEFINQCDQGLACLPDEFVGCEGVGCCTAFCSVSAPDCPEGMECMSWYAEEPPRPFADVGVCVVEM